MKILIRFFFNLSINFVKVGNFIVMILIGLSKLENGCYEGVYNIIVFFF